ncbi:energy transducer TonB [Carboxylicivirga sp. A043]|uniref:energy transducer TonB n=1 Tax=Carboxylicivirga litoralis TaxID=2816963 RepID=UPI0021CB26D9|nr:energy transducer TonB [Carboxylicivirga sp. A043]MCU4157050.1 energy transducer TonB [Carboxylicivirga sp. A043]
MKKLSYALVLLMFTVSIVAQESTMKQKFIEETRIEAPVFIGVVDSDKTSQQTFSQHLQQELAYLSELDYLYDEGVVAVDFIVEKDGSVSNLSISNSVSKTIDEAVLRVISQSNHMWQAGKINGATSSMDKTVFVKFDIPGNDSHNELAANYLQIAIKQLYAINTIESKYVNEDKILRKSQRKTNSAENYLLKAEQYKPNDLSITFWQARTYELQGKNDLKQQMLDKYLELTRHDVIEKSLTDDVLFAVITLD